jgi:DNA (cytosine-5)-methyltransferase 1
MTAPTIGSLFSGYGGLDLAAEHVLDARTVWTCDVDPAASRILRHRFPHAPNLGDITAVDWTCVPPVDVITGGFPCQDVSHAGARKGLGPGTRTGLWARMADAIDHLRPQLVVAENVRGLLSAAADSDVEPCPWCMGGAATANLLCAHSDLFSRTWPTSGMTRRGTAYAPPTSAPLTAGSASSSSPGPWCLAAGDRSWAGCEPDGDPGRCHASVFNDGQTLEAWQERHERERAKGYNGNGGGTPLAMQVQMLPTPTASDWKGPNRSESGSASSRGMATVAETLLPTPTASDRFGAGNHGEGGADLRTTVDTLFPTPRATDGTNGGPNQRGTSGDLMLPSAVQLLPTPSTASQGVGGGSADRRPLQQMLGVRTSPRSADGELF